MIKYLVFSLLGILLIAGSPKYTKISDVQEALTASNNALVSNGKVGIDISQYNSIDWGLMYEKREAIKFIYLRATCGTVPDKSLSFNMENIRRYKIYSGSDIGIYHFYKWNQSVPNQVKSFLKQWETYRDVITLAPVIDIEKNPPIKDNLFLPNRRKQEEKELVQFVKEIARLTKRTPIIYTNKDYYESWILPILSLHAYPLWLAHYKNIEDILENSEFAYRDIKNPICMIQYTDKGKIESSKGNIDLNIAFSNSKKKR
jgi:GH25 family lysozyme M1 (1,4-beta-N-acetylmuramidase)